MNFIDKMNFRRILLAAAALAGFCCACDKSATGTLFNGSAGASFASGVTYVEVGEDDDHIIRIPVNRGTLDIQKQDITFRYDTSGTGTPADSLWTETDPSGIFSLSTSRIIFPDNAYTAYAIVNFSDAGALMPSKKYHMQLILKGCEDSFRTVKTNITVTRKLHFEKYGDCSFFDACIFDNAYDCELYKAREGEIYRAMDPYTEGLIAEEYAAEGCMSNPPAYVEFYVESDGKTIKYEPFYTGMLAPTPQGNFPAYAYWPGDYKWGRDFSAYNSKNIKVSDREFDLYPVYCAPKFQYGYLNEGAYPLTIKLK